MCSSPRLIAAYHALHRLSMPRHPPCALLRLISNLIVAAGPAMGPERPGLIPHTRPSLAARTDHPCVDCQRASRPRRAGTLQANASEKVKRVRATSETLSATSEEALTRDLQKGGDPAAGSPTATLLRLRPSH